MMDILKKNFFKPLSVMKKECKDSNREKKYIKKGATFYGVNTPFVDFLQKEDKEFQHQIFNLDLQETPPYFGFPEEMVQRK